MHASPRALTLAASIAWRHAAADPVRAHAAGLASTARRRCAGGSGSPGRTGGRRRCGARETGTRRWPPWTPRPGAWPRSALAVDQPDAAAAALARLADDDRARPVLAARLAWRRAASPRPSKHSTAHPAPAPGACARRLAAERALLAPTAAPGQSMIMASSGQIAPVSGHDHETPAEATQAAERVRDACCTWSPTPCRPRAPATRSGRTRSRWPSAPPGSTRTW